MSRSFFQLKKSLSIAAQAKEDGGNVRGLQSGNLKRKACEALSTPKAQQLYTREEIVEVDTPSGSYFCMVQSLISLFAWLSRRAH
jgi:hypothetical protein